MEQTETNQLWAGQVDEGGRLVLPVEPRMAVGLPDGTPVVIESDGDSLRILPLARYRQEADHAAWADTLAQHTA